MQGSKGDIIQSQAKEIEGPSNTNTQAKAVVFLHSLMYIETTQVDVMIIETDSLLLKNIVEKSVNYHPIEYIEETWRLLQGK